MSDKATRAQIQIGSYSVEGFMLPDSSYVMSQTQAAELVGLTERNARDFLRSKALKSLLGEDYTPAISEFEADADQTPGIEKAGSLSPQSALVQVLTKGSRFQERSLILH